ncbi:MAG: PEP/pyruvate-binding domain-containing protein, partial [Acidobacteriota bacterium]
LTAMSYRLNRGLCDEDSAMSVGCLQMVDATAGGVVYSQNPIDPRDNTLVINAVWGLPKTVVDGIGDADVFVTSRESSPSVLRREIAVKTHQLRCHPGEGLLREEIAPDRQSGASLTEAQVLEIARLALRLEEHYGTPQDIEWAIDPQGTVIVLQSRPLPAAAGADRSPDREPDAPPALLEGGVTASPGTGAGPVFIVRKDADLLLFPAGAVLAASYPAPRLAPLLGRACGVIAEHGGVAGHLASVAREFRVPALFGIQGALQRLETGQWVTLDADRRRVHEGRIEALLSRAPEKPHPMEGTPVGTLLADIARHVVPLNLLDPDAPVFTPGNCRTLHDITRFCHEKVVEEMFQFGRDHHFPERSSKQLVCQVPMQWWVLNLDDGFREEVRGRQVKLENIVSLPMLALWEGITAFPWEGPPPVDGKGFLSVMFEATANRALVAGVRSSYGQRNYFMISRNYCSLTSRLGFHFSEVEALVGERLEENYLSFLFKGGAADFDRRFRRVHFIREILEEFGFRVGLKEDHLDARVQDHPVDFMLTRLKILGHLTIHTRQLDMIMANETAVRHYRAKILEQLQSLLGGKKAPPAPREAA